MRKKDTYNFLPDLLYFDSQWLKEQTDICKTPAVEALLGGIHADLDFSSIINGFHLERLAFLEIAKLIQCFFTNITLNAMTYNTFDLAKQGLSDDKFKIDHLGMGVMETWRGTPDGKIRGFAIGSDVPFVTGTEKSEAGSKPCVR